MSTRRSFDLTYQTEERSNCEPWNWYTLDDFLENGYHDNPAAAQAWLDADVSPQQARLYEEMGMSQQDAWDWGMVPEAVQSFLHGGFTRDEAWDWAEHDIFGYEAMFWRHGGFTPREADALRNLGTSAGQPALWAVTGLSPADALDHAMHGASAADFLAPPELEGTWPVLPEVEGDWRLHPGVLDEC